ncbi:MAG TPA: biotin/lipoyl-containing protein [Methylomirabilota bacterium]|nr:biotin/lipoyl-containing protein [Methylomirabilota bacterium]
MIRLRCGGDVRTAEPRAAAQGVEVVVDGTRHVLDVEAVAPGVFVLRDGTRRETFHCVRDGGRIHLFWRGATYVLDEVSESERAAQRHAAHALEAPMPGRVIAIKVQPGQAVSHGDEILVVEAMKMENAIRAPRDGVVKSIPAKVGDMVGPGTVLVEMEE